MNLKNKSTSHEFDIPNYWLLTYSDMVTIFLCFFIIFFTLSANQNSFLYKVKASLKDQINSLEAKNQTLEHSNTNLLQKNEHLAEENQTLAEELFQLKDIQEDMATSPEDFISYLREHDLLNEVQITQNQDGLLIRFKDRVLFPSGEGEISSSGYVVLGKIADKLKDIENPIRVEGFTDNQPIQTAIYPSNWDLSAARALSVVRYFIQREGLDQDRLSFMGWGEQRPIASNETSQGRARNRRIEITILK